MRCLEPACGVGHMARVLRDYFGVVASDIHDYGHGEKADFLRYPSEAEQFDWVITNPPFRLAEQFVTKAISIAKIGVAIFARTVFIESIGRYENLFSRLPPSKFAQFTERVPLLKGRLDRKATTATGYCWLVWEKGRACRAPELIWIPPVAKSSNEPATTIRSQRS